MSTNSDHDETKTRQGTISSARFNILSTMVGGGSLSLPLAFYQVGNGLVAPLILIFIAVLVEYSVYFLIQAARMCKGQSKRNESTSSTMNITNNSNSNIDATHDEIDQDTTQQPIIIGTTSYESVAAQAFGTNARYFSMVLLFTICFFTIIGYSVLLRDMLLPLTELFTLYYSDPGRRNIPMLFGILIVTPLCTLPNLTALQNVGALSMLSLLTLSVCIAYRSIQCNFSPSYADIRLEPWYKYITFIPSSSAFTISWSSIHNFLNALPIFVTVFMCHFNILPVFNEIKNPTTERMNTLVKSSIYSALGFYIFIGFTGSMYGNCVNTSSDDENQDKYVVKDNILLSFPEDDSLINLGRACLTLTITLAFPVLVVPARDVFLRATGILLERGNDSKTQAQVQATVDIDNPSELAEPLLSQNAVDEENEYTQDENITGNDRMINSSYIRIITSICILWIGALLACVVTSIDTVWDILGSSLSLIMGIFIPCGAYLVLSKLDDNREEAHLDGSCNEERKLRYVAWFIIYLFVPITVMCSGNAIYNVMND